MIPFLIISGVVIGFLWACSIAFSIMELCGNEYKTKKEFWLDVVVPIRIHRLVRKYRKLK